MSKEEKQAINPGNNNPSNKASGSNNKQNSQGYESLTNILGTASRSDSTFTTAPPCLDTKGYPQKKLSLLNQLILRKKIEDYLKASKEDLKASQEDPKASKEHLNANSTFTTSSNAKHHPQQELSLFYDLIYEAAIEYVVERNWLKKKDIGNKDALLADLSAETREKFQSLAPKATVTKKNSNVLKLIYAFLSSATFTALSIADAKNLVTALLNAFCSVSVNVPTAAQYLDRMPIILRQITKAYFEAETRERAIALKIMVGVSHYLGATTALMGLALTLEAFAPVPVNALNWGFLALNAAALLGANVIHPLQQKGNACNAFKASFFSWTTLLSAAGIGGSLAGIMMGENFMQIPILLLIGSISGFNNWSTRQVGSFEKMKAWLYDLLIRYFNKNSDTAIIHEFLNDLNTHKDGVLYNSPQRVIEKFYADLTERQIQLKEESIWKQIAKVLPKAAFSLTVMVLLWSLFLDKSEKGLAKVAALPDLLMSGDFDAFANAPKLAPENEALKYFLAFIVRSGAFAHTTLYGSGAAQIFESAWGFAKKTYSSLKNRNYRGATAMLASGFLTTGLAGLAYGSGTGMEDAAKNSPVHLASDEIFEKTALVGAACVNGNGTFKYLERNFYAEEFSTVFENAFASALLDMKIAIEKAYSKGELPDLSALTVPGAETEKAKKTWLKQSLNNAANVQDLPRYDDELKEEKANLVVGTPRVVLPSVLSQAIREAIISLQKELCAAFAVGDQADIEREILYHLRSAQALWASDRGRAKTQLSRALEVSEDIAERILRECGGMTQVQNIPAVQSTVSQGSQGEQADICQNYFNTTMRLGLLAGYYTERNDSVVADIMKQIRGKDWSREKMVRLFRSALRTGDFHAFLDETAHKKLAGDGKRGASAKNKVVEDATLHRRNCSSMNSDSLRKISPTTPASSAPNTQTRDRDLETGQSQPRSAAAAQTNGNGHGGGGHHRGGLGNDSAFGSDYYQRQQEQQKKIDETEDEEDDSATPSCWNRFSRRFGFGSGK
jgi:hypothetical protein